MSATIGNLVSATIARNERRDLVSPSNGGFDFALDPERPAPPGRAIWRADILRFTVLIGPVPDGFDDTARIDPTQLNGISNLEESSDGLHVTVGQKDDIAHLRFEPTDRPWGSILLPQEPECRARIGAARWFMSWLHGKAHGPSPEGAWLTTVRRRHLRTLLRLLDERRSGASARDLAATMIDVDLRALSAAAWIDSSERKRIQRWIRQAEHLVASGYRDLLRGP